MNLSPALAAHVERARAMWSETPGLDAMLAGASPRIVESVAKVLAASDFVARSCVQDPGCLAELLRDGRLEHPVSTGDYAREARALDIAIDEAGFSRWLRRWRRRSMLRIAWRDLAGWATLDETLGGLSALADAAVELSCRYARAQLAPRFGVPRSADGAEQPLVVIGMGKLGGGELNFSSDIDLVFLFPEFGETDGARSIANEEYFTRLGQMLIRLLDTATADGFVFRTDMRLRPFGDSGPLVASFSSFEDYLLRHGRAWERYAYVKARALTAPEAYAESYANAVRPFVYRRYVDFGVFESLREMKRLIEREVARRDLADNVKLGPGGIREVEFVVQALQLVRGGRDRRLQTPSLLRALAFLDASHMLPAGAANELGVAYMFLRKLENRLQMLDDQQTHALPTETLARERVAVAMDFDDWDALRAELDRHRARVSQHFRAVVFAPEGESQDTTFAAELSLLWDADEPRREMIAAALERVRFDDPVEGARLLEEFRGSGIVRRLDSIARRRLRELIPWLVSDLGQTSQPVMVLRRLLRILEAIGARSTYFALLQESRSARTRLVQLCGHGDFLADQIAAHPLLLDELIDDRILRELPDRAAMAAELALRLEQLTDDEPESQVEALRQFQRAALFRVAVADLTGRLPVMRVSDRLTDIAELIVEQAMRLAWSQITGQFGTPLCGTSGERRAVRVCAIGYGKLGGKELGYASDLDIVFLHDSSGDVQETDAAKPLDNQIFFVRLAQRIVHLLTMHSRAGRLYEVDMRLRPSGKGGMLVTSITAFGDYQRSEAWTWEHQALLHARAVAGAPELREAFESLRLGLLQDAVRRETLQDEVRGMRERMRRELSRASAGQFDLKQDPGGMADIEFLAQYWALRWARDKPPVALFSDTIRQLESVASADLVSQEIVDGLTGAYRAYRVRLHHRSLANESPVIPDHEFVTERATVVAIWREAMGERAAGGL